MDLEQPTMKMKNISYLTFEELQREVEAYKILKHRRDRLEDEIKILMELLKQMNDKLEKMAKEIQRQLSNSNLLIPSDKVDHDDLPESFKVPNKEFVFVKVLNGGDFERVRIGHIDGVGFGSRVGVNRRDASRLCSWCCCCW